MPARAKALSLEILREKLTTGPTHIAGSRYLLAYSGGIDSTALLALMRELVERDECLVHAAYIDHGLHPQSANWAEFCASVCHDLDIPFQFYRAAKFPCDVSISVEAWAREQRYSLLSRQMAQGDVLLTAHNADDQCETVLAHLLRGSGCRGLAGMQAWRQFATGWHARPLLDVGREQITAYVTNTGLRYLDDPGNQDMCFRRNVLHNSIVPQLEQHWPGMRTAVLRSASHQRQLSTLLDELAIGDLKVAGRDNGMVLSITALLQLGRARQTNLIRHWLHRLRLAPPSATVMEHILQDVIASDPSRVPGISWSGVVLHRFRQHLYAEPSIQRHDAAQSLVWDADKTLRLASGTLFIQTTRGPGLAMERCPNRLQVRFRQGGERIRLAGQPHTRSLKKLFQQQAILPWKRDRIPLIYVNDELIAVAGIGIAEAWAGTVTETARRLHWQPVGRMRAVE